MRLALDYRPLPDRLELGWQDAAGAHRLWLTRRQALALLVALEDADDAAGACGGGAAAAPAATDRQIGGASGVAAGSDGAPAAGALPAEALVLGLRLRPGRLLLRTTAGTVGVSLPDGTVVRLRGRLLRVCELAGWDVAAGLARLRSAALARAAIERARRA
jgi:hypothetical protein